MTRERSRMVGAAVLGALAVLLAVLNLDDVEVNWILGTWQTPLIVVIVVALAAGGAIGFAAARYRAKGRTAPARKA